MIQNHFTKLQHAQRAVEKHTKALLESLKDPLRELGYRLEPITPLTAFDNGAAKLPMDTGWPGEGAIAVLMKEPPTPVRSPRQHQFICPDCDRTFALAVHLGRHRHARHPGADVKLKRR